MPRTLSDEDCDAIVQKLIGRMAVHLAQLDNALVKKDVAPPSATLTQAAAPPAVLIEQHNRYVRANELLTILWGPESRPSKRWLDRMKARRIIPFIKLGSSVYYDPNEVKCALNRFEIRSKI